MDRRGVRGAEPRVDIPEDDESVASFIKEDDEESTTFSPAVDRAAYLGAAARSQARRPLSASAAVGVSASDGSHTQCEWREIESERE